jgi:hypothetical protein
MLAVHWYEAPMFTAVYIFLVSAAAVVSLATLAGGAIILLFALAIAWRHELRANAAALPHSLILRG